MTPQRQSHIIKQKTGPDDPALHANLQEALEQVDAQDVIQIADELAERHTRIFSSLGPAPVALASQFPQVAEAVTHSKANARNLKECFAHRDFPALAANLIMGERPAPVRVAVFVEKLDGLDTRLAIELASGLLYNHSPAEHWLWTRWLWDPTTSTGILPLFAGSVHNLIADNIADGYSRVGVVTAMAVRFGDDTGLLVPELVEDPKRAPFANIAFLACAYSVYLYGTTGWRLSREFNNLLPTLPNLARRLLGLPKRRP